MRVLAVAAITAALVMSVIALTVSLTRDTTVRIEHAPSGNIFDRAP